MTTAKYLKKDIKGKCAFYDPLQKLSKPSCSHPTPVFKEGLSPQDRGLR